jgi:hypothetical protein
MGHRLDGTRFRSPTRAEVGDVEMLRARSSIGSERRPELILRAGIAFVVGASKAAFVIRLVAAVGTVFRRCKVILVVIDFDSCLKFLLLPLFLFSLLFSFLPDLADAVLLLHTVIQGELLPVEAGLVNPGVSLVLRGTELVEGRFRDR